MVNGADAGTQYNFTFSTDAFTGQPLLPGHSYSYTAVAYATNPYFTDSVCAPLTSTFAAGHHQQVFCILATGIYENASESNPLITFPSPASQTISVDLRDFNTTVHLTIYDTSGKIVRQEETAAGLQELNVSDLAEGFYFLRAVSGEKTGFSRFVRE